jgi:hypothetical protein
MTHKGLTIEYRHSPVAFKAAFCGTPMQ